MLCQACQIAFQASCSSRVTRSPRDRRSSTNRSSTTRTYPTPRSLHTSLLAGCPTCRRIWILILESEHDTESEPVQKAMRGDIPGTYEEFSNQYGIGKDAKIEPWMELKVTSEDHGRDSEAQCILDIRRGTLRSCRFRVFPVSTIPELVPSFQPRRPPTSLDARLWRFWLHTCLKSHKKCRGLEPIQDFVPKRLVEISYLYDWRLVYPPPSDIVEYLTLSHCWGSSEHLKLTKETHSAFLEYSDNSKLPKTYQDAFEITMSLGYKFIWIDSLCIIQDDEEDWKVQSSLMGSVYGGARCNIAAGWAKDGDGGCFGRRDPFLVGSQMPLLLQDGSVTNFDILFDDLYVDGFPNGPLNRRAWVVQERYLAIRQLVFSKYNVFWECSEPPDTRWRMPLEWKDLGYYCDIEKPTLEHHDENAFRKTWAKLVEYYSGCRITRVSDRLIALAGLASRSREAAQGEYLAGLWEKDLQAQLCWVVDEDRIKNCRRISYGVAPTWSWANIGAPIQWNSTQVWDKSDKSDDRPSPVWSRPVWPPPVWPCHVWAEVVRASVNADDPTNVSGELVVKGIAMRARRKFPEKDAFNRQDLLEATNLPWTLIDRIDHIDAGWDEHIPVGDDDTGLRKRLQMKREGDLLLMCLHCEYTERRDLIRGLILMRSPDPPNQTSYMRLGHFSANLRMSLRSEFAKRLGLPDTDQTIPPELMTINLGDPRLADLVQEVTII